MPVRRAALAAAPGRVGGGGDGGVQQGGGIAPFGGGDVGQQQEDALCRACQGAGAIGVEACLAAFAGFEGQAAQEVVGFDAFGAEKSSMGVTAWPSGLVGSIVAISSTSK